MNDSSLCLWPPGIAPLAVVMISLNEGHNMEAVLLNLQGWAHEVFLVDSYSADNTVDVALRYGVSVVQRKFRGFGDQWNFALSELPITAPWVMKLDPDERLTEQLKASIIQQISQNTSSGIALKRRLWFMGKPLPVKQEITRAWKTGKCRFTEVAVNEHPIVAGKVVHVKGELEHHDSPNLHHWFDKQNKYSTLEAEAKNDGVLATSAKLFGTKLEQRMWSKKHFDKLPFRFFAVFLFYYVIKGMFRAGWRGYAWSRLRSQVYLMRYYKYKELQMTEIDSLVVPVYGSGEPDSRVKQYP